MSSAKGSVELKEWFADKGRMDEEQPCTPQEAQAVRDYAVASPDRAALTTEQAAHLLLKADTEHPNMNDPKEKGYRIASLIFDVQREYDDLQPIMLDLFEAIEHFDSNSTAATSIKNLSRTNMKACSPSVVELPAAMRWVQITGSLILHCVQPHAKNSEVAKTLQNVGREGNLQKLDQLLPSGFTLQRWQLWKDGLAQIIADAGNEINSSTMQGARAGLQARQSFETGENPSR
ncbi:MAG: hypothetical protein Q9159_004633 [Coniocarpon cinnabarinum]